MPNRKKNGYKEVLYNLENYPKYDVNKLISNLEKVNRNNPNKIVSYYSEPNVIQENIREIMNIYNKTRIKENSDVIIEEKTSPDEDD